MNAEQGSKLRERCSKWIENQTGVITTGRLAAFVEAELSRQQGSSFEDDAPLTLTKFSRQQEPPWICDNPDCRTEYAEYVNGCPKCSENKLHFSVRQHAAVQKESKSAAVLRARLEEAEWWETRRYDHARNQCWSTQGRCSACQRIADLQRQLAEQEGRP